MLPIAECHVLDLESHADPRGSFTEIFRAAWPGTFNPVQWNYVRSEPHVLRGIHVHVRHHDYLILVHGRMQLYLHDVRPESGTSGRSCQLELGGDRLRAVVIPPGVAHGFYYPEASAHIYSVSEYWDSEDELGCRWDSPGLGMRIPIVSPLLSPRDAEAGSFADVVRRFVLRRERILADTAIA